MRDNHAEQLNNDASRNVRHDTERKDRELQECATTKQVHNSQQVVALVVSKTRLDVLIRNTGSWYVGTDAVEHDDPDCKQQLAS